MFRRGFHRGQDRLFSPLWNRMTRPMREMTILYIAITLVAVCIYLMAGDEIFPALILALFTVSSGAGPMTVGLPPTPGLIFGGGLVSLLSALPLLTIWQMLHRRSGTEIVHHMELRAFFCSFHRCRNAALCAPHIARHTKSRKCDRLRIFLCHLFSLNERPDAAGGDSFSQRF